MIICCQRRNAGTDLWSILTRLSGYIFWLLGAIQDSGYHLWSPWRYRAWLYEEPPSSSHLCPLVQPSKVDALRSCQLNNTNSHFVELRTCTNTVTLPALWSNTSSPRDLCVSPSPLCCSRKLFKTLFSHMLETRWLSFLSLPVRFILVLLWIHCSSSLWYLLYAFWCIE